RHCSEIELQRQNIQSLLSASRVCYLRLVGRILQRRLSALASLGYSFA
ncbi:hypothetical protein A2U01_0069445, partial [Trifolium medium]|nr:hypothetical protein [Trifolium medium]